MSDGGFSYTDQINKQFNNMTGAITSTNIFSIVTNTTDIMDQTKSVLFTGADCQGKTRTIGDKFFIQSGVCDTATSEKSCRGAPRYLYIDNVPKPYFPCVDPSQPYDSNCGKTGYTGLVPGLIQDMMRVNPFEIVSSMTGKGSVVNDTCVLRTEDVGYQDINGGQYYSRQTRCSPAASPLICTLQVKEGMDDCDSRVACQGSGWAGWTRWAQWLSRWWQSRGGMFTTLLVLVFVITILILLARKTAAAAAGGRRVPG
jgi:hypothetical protein